MRREENWRIVRRSREGGEEASYKRPAGQGDEGGHLDGTAKGSHFRRRFGRCWKLRESSAKHRGRVGDD